MKNEKKSNHKRLENKTLFVTKSTKTKNHARKIIANLLMT